MSVSGNEVVQRSVYLQKYWQTRNKKMQSWYSQIQMMDKNAKKDMESFVGNDPRVSFNEVASLLNQKIPHRLDPSVLTAEMMQPAADLSILIETMWSNVYEWYRQRGRDFLRDLIQYMLATGWYSVFSTISLDGTTGYAEVWNPATVYQSWDDMLVECAHITSLSSTQAKRLATRNKWSIKSNLSEKNPLYDLWWVEMTNPLTTLVRNAIVLGNELVKPDTIETRFHRIPIFTAPVAGLPDNGELTSGSETWKGEIGQSFIATNENVNEAFNKWWSFMLQMLKDTAIPRSFERSSSSKEIVKPETWYRRGPHYKLGPQDEIGFINPPPIPVELRNAQLDMEAMLQQGSGNSHFQQQMTTYMMSLASSSKNRMAQDYHKGVINCLTDIDNFWVTLIKENNYKPYGKSLPSGIPEDAKISASYELRIPGDLVQRATTARMLDPEFELSDDRIMDELFPEIKNPMEEEAKVRASRAKRNPIFAQVSLIEALKEEALVLRNAKQPDAATLYEKAAAMLEQQMTPQQQQGQGQSLTQSMPGIPTTVQPSSPNQPELGGQQ